MTSTVSKSTVFYSPAGPYNFLDRGRQATKVTGIDPMSTVAAVTMPDETRTEFCTYTQVKVDDELTDRIREAVAKLSRKSAEAGGSRVTVQEFVSDNLNQLTAKILGIKPLKRRPPPPPPSPKKRPGKPRPPAP